ncbi:MAG: hypothetical protein ACOX8Q_02960 [Christensenellales bacterium]
MPFENNASRDKGCFLADELCDHLDSVVIIFTSCFCFTGLLVGVSDDAVKIITRNSHCCPGRSFFGKITIIRLSDIEAVTFCNTSF